MAPTARTADPRELRSCMDRSAQTLHALMPQRTVESDTDYDPAVKPAPAPAASAGPQRQLSIPPASKHRRWPDRVGSTKPRMSKASNATSSSRPSPPSQHFGPGRFPETAPHGQTRRPNITYVWLDNGHTGSTVADPATKAGFSVDSVSGPKPRYRLDRPAPPVGGRTHQRPDQPTPTARPALRSHSDRPPRIPRPRPNGRAATTT